MKLISTIVIATLTISTLVAQLEVFQIEKFGMQLDVVIPDPMVSNHSPTGLIYKDTSMTTLANLSNRYLRIADGPIGYQLNEQNTLFTETGKNYFSINRYDNPFDHLVWDGPSQTGYWGARDPESFGSQFDFNTWGNIYTINDQSNRLSELTHCDGTGALKLYRYDGFNSTNHTLTIDDNGNPMWKASGGIIFIGLLKSNSLLARIKSLTTSKVQKNGTDTLLEGYQVEELQKLLPEVVSQSDDGEVGINYFKFGTVAIEAIKEQQKIIETLEERMTKMEWLLLEE